MTASTPRSGEYRKEVGDDRRGAAKRLIIAVLLGTTLLVALGVVVLSLHPEEALRCLLQGRNGWELELPSAPVTEDAYRTAIEAQTDCVSVDATYIDTGSANDGFVLEPTNTKIWVGYGEPVYITVEGRAEAG